MKQILRSLVLLLALSGVAHAEVWEARYGVAETFNFKLYNADGTLDVDESDGGTEVSLSCNEGAETTATNDFVDEGTFYSIALTAAEMQCERIAVVIAATTTEVFFIQTIGDVSAMTPPTTAEGVVDSGTAQSATGTTLVLRAALAMADDTANGMTLVACGSTQGYCQSRLVTDYVATTDTATVETWTVTPSGTITYYLFGSAPGSGAGASAQEVWEYATRTLTALDEDSTTIDLNASYVGGVTVFDEDLTTIDINATTLGTVTTATNVTTVNGLAANVITAAATAADAGTEIATAVLTAAESAPIAADAQEMNGVTILGAGTSGDKWRGE